MAIFLAGVATPGGPLGHDAGVGAVGIAVLVYVGLQLALGYWISRRIETEDDYLVAGRSLGFGMSMFTVFATWFGAETCIGAAGQAYSEGLAGTTADPFGYALALLLMGVLFARKLWKLKLVTLADLVRQRFGVGVERLAVLLMVPTSVIWAAAQIKAFGHVLGSVSELDITLTVTIAAAVVIAYTTFGGLLADAYTDLVQGIVLIAGLVIVAVFVFTSGDAATLGSLPPEALSPVAPGESAWAVIEKWAIPICGSLVAQELVARVLAARSGETARRATLAAGGLYLAIGFIPVLVGLVAIKAMPGIEAPDQVLIAQAQRYLPQLLFVIFAGALVSAILSTVDSALLVAGSLVAHNLVAPLRPLASDAAKLRTNRVAVTGFGVIAYALALGADSVYGLVEEASAFGTAGILVIVGFALYSRLGGALSAATSLLAGTGVYALGELTGAFDHPYLWSLVVSLVGYLVPALLWPPSNSMTARATLG